MNENLLCTSGVRIYGTSRIPNNLLMNNDILKLWNKITRHKIKVFLNISVVNWIKKSGVNLSMPNCCATLLPFYPWSKLSSWAAFCFLAPRALPMALLMVLPV